MESFDIKEQVREYICSGADSQDGFLSERQIASHFNLKRNNTREVLLALEGEGVLQRHPKRGYSYVNYDSTDPETVILVRYVVEREAARKAIENSTREDMVRLTLIFEEMAEFAARKDIAGFRKADMEFHTALIAASHDNMLIKIFEFMKATLFRRTPPAFTELFERTQISHQVIFDAFKSKNAAALDKVLRRHLGQHDAVKIFHSEENTDSECPC